MPTGRPSRIGNVLHLAVLVLFELGGLGFPDRGTFGAPNTRSIAPFELRRIAISRYSKDSWPPWTLILARGFDDFGGWLALLAACNGPLDITSA